MIVDASVLLSAFFPDEAQTQAQAILRQHAAGLERLKAPTLIVYEVTIATWQAERRGRITSVQAVDDLSLDGMALEPPPSRLMAVSQSNSEKSTLSISGKVNPCGS